MANTVTRAGTPVHLAGNFPAKGQTAPAFTLVGKDLSDVSLTSFGGKRKVLNIFPSIDTGVCAASARKFNEAATDLENTVVINVSKDLPFALGRFCAAEGLNNVETLSDFRGSFGDDYGVAITDGPMKGLLSRAVIVTDENYQVIYTELVPDINNEPNYEASLNALK